ncbi:NlpC/P60 family protein [Streptomyces sp. NBC_01537]|uniref:C40 family peptidase n=1 Tax=Streptomyces sp. NBC_01537 TaxID=2903896 RepID=UPI00386E5E93
MASHARPKQRSSTGSAAARTAATIAIAGAASATMFTEASSAEPRLTPAQAQARVDRLYEEAETATEAYNGAQERADTARAAIEHLQDEQARKTGRVNATRDRLGTIAAAQYRSGGIDPTVQLALDSTPAEYLERAQFIDQLGNRASAALRTLAAQRRELTQVRHEADAELATLRGAQDELRTHKRTVEDKLKAAQQILDRLTAAERAAVGASTSPLTSRAARGVSGGGRTALSGSGSSTADGDVPAPSARAAQAVSFAYGALGLPYVWGATGPSSYDCSGLTQAAWRSAGVSLPRTTYTQINAGTRVSRSQLQPGDLVFFYSGISHVGLYIGNGQMIHAPHPGAPVRIAPIDEMPFAGAARPA